MVRSWFIGLGRLREFCLVVGDRALRGLSRVEDKGFGGMGMLLSLRKSVKYNHISSTIDVSSYEFRV